MEVDVCFQGWLRGAEITKVYEQPSYVPLRVVDEDGQIELYDESEDEPRLMHSMTVEEFQAKIRDGEFALDFRNLLEDPHKENIELSDIEFPS